MRKQASLEGTVGSSVARSSRTPSDYSHPSRGPPTYKVEESQAVNLQQLSQHITNYCNMFNVSSPCCCKLAA